MPTYEYRCQDCREVFGIDRSMNDSKEASCNACTSENVTRIWNASILTGGITPDVGQGTVKSAPSSSAQSGCGSCSSSSCGTCH
jgi:putative FmdB family regulatory protein